VVDLGYNRNHGKWFANDVRRAIARYCLLTAGERVAVGLSGGKDSATLLFALWYLRRYGGLDCELSALHVRMAADYDTAPLQRYCDLLEVPYLETALEVAAARKGGSVCAACARLKRGAAARVLTGAGIRTIAYGHHATDAAETLLMNVVRHGRLGSFAPKVAVPGTPLTIIRPMLYLTEETVAAVHRRLALPLLATSCPYAAGNVRAAYKEALRLLEIRLSAPRLARRFVDAMEHPDLPGVPEGDAEAAR
jgi:tRNA(Ile)-lysidine synthase TilS/MesJ